MIDYMFLASFVFFVAFIYLARLSFNKSFDFDDEEYAISDLWFGIIWILSLLGILVSFLVFYACLVLMIWG